MTLLTDLEGSLNRDKKLSARKNTYELFTDPGIKLDSWKFQDWAYYRDDLPIYARGLFTSGNDIVVRGYNKFFNVGEVPSTKWEYLETHTVGPYECTVKENGCIVFIAGYKGKLVVTSKHSTGPRDDSGKNHALEASKHVAKHLASVGKIEAQLAETLESNGWTAVGELCDDNFEEHVLEYTPKEAGIYLTGINFNTRTFKTVEFARVQEFAAQWGFIKTESRVCETFGDLKSFVESCAETGSWNSREIEGFVVRCKLDDSDFFFKYKFEEPYLMYRHWREVTKAFLRNPTTTPKMHAKHRASSTEYLQFLARYLPTHPEIREKVLNDGKGIIELRNKFLQSTSLSEKDLLGLDLSELPTKYVLAPVATIGCGKTVVSVALTQLTGWGHVQNDDMPEGKSKKNTFTTRTLDALNTKDAVIYDRNNHQRRERDQMFTDLSEGAVLRGYKLVYICLNFWPKGPQADRKAVEVTEKRVQDRGNNHPTIRDMSPKMVQSIMKGFIGRYQPVVASKPPDDQFDSIIDLKVCEDGSRANVVRVLDHMHKEYGFKNYTSKEIDTAMEYALKYEATVPIKPLKQVVSQISYFGIQLDPKQVQSLIPELLGGQKLQKEFHVTLAHQKSHKQRFKELRQQYGPQLHMPYNKQQSVALGDQVRVHVIEYCYNFKLAAFKVESDLGSANETPHITVSLKPGVKAVESNTMLGSSNEESPVTRIPLDHWLEGQVCAYI